MKNYQFEPDTASETLGQTINNNFGSGSSQTNNIRTVDQIKPQL